jgi:hypothetical protein
MYYTYHSSIILQRQSRRRGPSSSLEIVPYNGVCEFSASMPPSLTGAQTATSASYSLLKSNDGHQLPVEINLKIIEKVMERDPKLVAVLMGLSRVC